MQSSIYFCLYDSHLGVTGVRRGRVLTSRLDMNKAETHGFDWSKYLVLFAYRENRWCVGNGSAASYIAIKLKVPVKFQKAGTDFTIRPHLDLPWEWGGGGMKRH